MPVSSVGKRDSMLAKAAELKDRSTKTSKPVSVRLQSSLSSFCHVAQSERLTSIQQKSQSTPCMLRHLFDLSVFSRPNWTLVRPSLLREPC